MIPVSLNKAINRYFHCLAILYYEDLETLSNGHFSFDITVRSVPQGVVRSAGKFEASYSTTLSNN